MLVLLAAALVGDLILLPALLAGPLGRWFKPRPPLAVAEPNGGPSQFDAATVNTDPQADKALPSESQSRTNVKVEQVQTCQVSAIHLASPNAGLPEPKGNRRRDQRMST
jgi:hypothetical protein